MQDLFTQLAHMASTHHVSHFKVTEVYLGSREMLKVFVHWKPHGRTTIEHIGLYDWLKEHTEHKVTAHTTNGLTTIIHLQEVGLVKRHGWSADVIDEKYSVANLVKEPKDVCLDCKDGYYYPFMGSKEPCKTCLTR